MDRQPMIHKLVCDLIVNIGDLRHPVLRMVAADAEAYEETHGHRDVDIQVDKPDEVDFRAVADRMLC